VSEMEEAGEREKENEDCKEKIKVIV
jgi:hypothetical protein